MAAANEQPHTNQQQFVFKHRNTLDLLFFTLFETIKRITSQLKIVEILYRPPIIKTLFAPFGPNIYLFGGKSIELYERFFTEYFQKPKLPTIFDQSNYPGDYDMNIIFKEITEVHIITIKRELIKFLNDFNNEPFFSELMENFSEVFTTDFGEKLVINEKEDTKTKNGKILIHIKTPWQKDGTPIDYRTLQYYTFKVSVVTTADPRKLYTLFEIHLNNNNLPDKVNRLTQGLAQLTFGDKKIEVPNIISLINIMFYGIEENPFNIQICQKYVVRLHHFFKLLYYYKEQFISNRVFNITNFNEIDILRLKLDSYREKYSRCYLPNILSMKEDIMELDKINQALVISEPHNELFAAASLVPSNIPLSLSDTTLVTSPSLRLSDSRGSSEGTPGTPMLVSSQLFEQTETSPFASAALVSATALQEPTEPQKMKHEYDKYVMLNIFTPQQINVLEKFDISKRLQAIKKMTEQKITEQLLSSHPNDRSNIDIFIQKLKIEKEPYEKYILMSYYIKLFVGIKPVLILGATPITGIIQIIEYLTDSEQTPALFNTICIFIDRILDNNFRKELYIKIDMILNKLIKINNDNPENTQKIQILFKKMSAKRVAIVSSASVSASVSAPVSAPAPAPGGSSTSNVWFHYCY